MTLLIDDALEDDGPSSCDLTGAYLKGANLTGANLSNAYLNSANLTDANLTNANLTDANLTDITWSNTKCPDGTNSDKNPSCGFYFIKVNNT